MIESKKTFEERAQEAVDALINKKQRAEKAKGAADLAGSRADLACKEYEHALRTTAAKYPEAVAAAGLAPGGSKVDAG